MYLGQVAYHDIHRTGEPREVLLLGEVGEAYKHVAHLLDLAVDVLETGVLEEGHHGVLLRLLTLGVEVVLPEDEPDAFKPFLKDFDALGHHMEHFGLQCRDVDEVAGDDEGAAVVLPGHLHNPMRQGLELGKPRAGLGVVLRIVGDVPVRSYKQSVWVHCCKFSKKSRRNESARTGANK